MLKCTSQYKAVGYKENSGQKGLVSLFTFDPPPIFDIPPLKFHSSLK